MFRLIPYVNIDRCYKNIRSYIKSSQKHRLWSTENFKCKLVKAEIHTRNTGTGQCNEC